LLDFFYFTKNQIFLDVEASRRSINTEVTVAMVEEDIEFTGSNREVLCKYVDGYLNRYYTLILEIFSMASTITPILLLRVCIVLV